MSDFLFAKDN